MADENSQSDQSGQADLPPDPAFTPVNEAEQVLRRSEKTQLVLMVAGFVALVGGGLSTGTRPWMIGFAVALAAIMVFYAYEMGKLTALRHNYRTELLSVAVSMAAMTVATARRLADQALDVLARAYTDGYTAGRPGTAGIDRAADVPAQPGAEGPPPGS